MCCVQRASKSLLLQLIKPLQLQATGEEMCDKCKASSAARCNLAQLFTVLIKPHANDTKLIENSHTHLSARDTLVSYNSVF